MEYFNLVDEPFRLTPDPRYVYLSRMHSKAKSYLDFAIWNRDGFVVMTGDIGSGKTTILNTVISNVDNDVVVAKIHQTQLDERQLLQAVLLELGINFNSDDKVTLLNNLNKYLIEQYKANKKVLLVIDEAQNLSIRALEELRLLSGLETFEAKLINIIIVGQPELRIMLESRELEQLSQRVRLRYHLKSLSKAETQGYIYHRLQIAGSSQNILFAEELMPYIYKYTGGVPRLINILCDTALICAYADEKKVVSLDTIKAAIGELNWVTYRRRQERLQHISRSKKRKGDTSARAAKAAESLPLDIDLADLE